MQLQIIQTRHAQQRLPKQINLAKPLPPARMPRILALEHHPRIVREPARARTHEQHQAAEGLVPSVQVRVERGVESGAVQEGNEGI